VVSNVEVKFYYADVATIGIGGFDPNGDGDPADGNFTYIGSYRVPTLGPSGSNHATAVALANWNIPVPPGDHWCVGIGIVGTIPPNSPEGNRSNNTAFRNFFDITLSTADFAFNIAPPPGARDQPFAVEFVKRGLPKGASVELVIDRALEKRLMAAPQGVTRLVEALLDSTGFKGSARSPFFVPWCAEWCAMPLPQPPRFPRSSLLVPVRDGQGIHGRTERYHRVVG
jgi:hypothetical protein